MSEDEINRAIAEHLGWSYGPIHIGDGLDVDECSHAWWRNGKAWVEGPPNYCGDLNAMHEAEKVLLADADTGYEYDMELNGVCECWEDGVMNYMKLWHATARQRAEAFLRVVGKWRGEE